MDPPDDLPDAAFRELAVRRLLATEVVARRIRLVGSDGVRRIEASVSDDGGAHFTIFDMAEAPKLVLGVGANGEPVEILFGPEQSGAFLTAKPWPALLLAGRDGVVRYSVGVGSDGVPVVEAAPPPAADPPADSAEPTTPPTPEA